MTTAEIDMPAAVVKDILDDIRTAMNTAPRSLQTTIGPSEYGNPCAKALIHALNGDKQPPNPDMDWKARVGSAIHSQCEAVFAPMTWRYRTETKVTIGEIDGQPISGSCDLYDAASGIVWDYKTKADDAACRKAAKDGPNARGRAQMHGYGRGFTSRTADVIPGKQNAVNYVGQIYLPRNGSLEAATWYAEPFDEQVVIDALDRATGLAQLVKAFGVVAALAMQTPCGAYLCSHCTYIPVTPEPNNLFGITIPKGKA